MPQTPPPGAVQVSLNGSIKYQTIDGWAVYPRYWEDDKSADRFDGSFERYLQPVSDLLVNQVGINAVRLEIWSGMENPTDRWAPFYQDTIGYTVWANRRYEKINDNADPSVTNLAGFRFEMFDYRFERMALPLKQALQARGEKLYITLCYVDFKWNADVVQGTLSHATNPAEYAEFVLVYFEHLKNKYGVTPDAFEIVLEPNNTERWRGPEIGRGLVAVRDRLARNGFTPQFIAPSNASTSGAISYFDAMIQIPGAAGALHTFAYHRYGESTGDVAAIYSRAQARGLKTAMLEKVDAGLDVLLEDLMVGHVSSWQQWAIAGKVQNGDNGGYYLMVDPASSPTSPLITMGKHTDLLSQVFRFVRGGARRIEAISDNADKKAVAFINPDGGYVVVVRAKAGGSPLLLTGLPVGTYGVRFVGNNRVRTDLAPIVVSSNGALITQIPGPGAITVYRTP
jgi:hypothetical protein